MTNPEKLGKLRFLITNKFHYILQLFISRIDIFILVQLNIVFWICEPKMCATICLYFLLIHWKITYTREMSRLPSTLSLFTYFIIQSKSHFFDLIYIFSFYCAAEFLTYLMYCRSLGFEEDPDYSHLRQIFRTLFHRQGFTYDYIFDWNLLKFVSNILYWHASFVLE